LIVLGCAAELAAAILLLFGWRTRGIIVGICLLAAFTILLVVFPLRDGQECGCLGSLPNGYRIQYIDPFVRNAFLSSVHLLAFVSVAPGARGRDPHCAGVARGRADPGDAAQAAGGSAYLRDRIAESLTRS